MQKMWNNPVGDLGQEDKCDDFTYCPGNSPKCSWQLIVSYLFLFN